MKLIREIAFLSISLALAGCQPSTNQSASGQVGSDKTHTANKVARTPVESATKGATDEQVLDSAETCIHLAGEFGGDQSERDKEVTEEQDSLKCDQALGNLKALKARLPKDSPLLTRVNEALSDLE